MSMRIGDWALLGLVLLAAIQVAWIVTRSRAPEPDVAAPPQFLAVGDVSGEVLVVNAVGESRPLVGRGEALPTLVLAFHSECAHCATVAPAWAEWLREQEFALRILGVSREPVETSTAYARENGWDVDVVQVPDDFTAPGGRLVMRTPWLFLLDPDGVIVFEAHGSRLDELAAVLEAEPVVPSLEGGDR
jgi:hypothetical protein